MAYQQTSPPPAQQTPPPQTSLDKLKEELEALKVKASQQEAIKKAIDATEKNVEDYAKKETGATKSNGELLKEEYDALKQKITDDLATAKKQLTTHEGDVKQAIDDVIGAAKTAEDEIAQSEEPLTGKTERDLRVLQRSITKDQSTFTQLSFSALKARVALAKGYWTEANATAPTLEGIAESYALLTLALDVVCKTWVQSDVDSAESNFEFPPDKDTYSEWLIAAYSKTKAEAEDFTKQQKALDDSKADLAKQIKDLATLRTSRKKDVVAKAKEAVKDAAKAAAGKGAKYAT